MRSSVRAVAAIVTSALAAATLLVAPTARAAPAIAAPVDPTVVINEIVYDKVSGVAADSIELYNAGSSPVDLTGWRVADDKRTEFGDVPAVSLAPGEFLVLTQGVEFPFGLGKGDEVVLYDAAAVVVDDYDYDYAATAPLADWSCCPDGIGDWAHATQVTLDAANVCGGAPEPTTGSIVINEVDSQPADWVELYNPGTGALDISGYEIRENSDDHRWTFLPGTSIAAGEFLVVDEATVALVDDVQKRFSEPIGIGSADRIRLFDASGAQIDDTGAWTGHAAIDGDSTEATLARCPDGVGAFALAHKTQGAANSCVRPDVAINEIEFVNPSAAAVDASGLVVKDDDAHGYTIPVGTTIAAGGHLVIEGAALSRWDRGPAEQTCVSSMRRPPSSPTALADEHLPHAAFRPGVVDAGREPVRDPRRRHADRYDSRGNPDDMFGWLKYSVRSAQLAPALESVYDECDPDYLYGNGSTDYPKPQQIIAETVPSWFVGIGVQVLLAGLLR